MYYKERIIELTRDLFLDSGDDTDVNESYHAYMKCCIRYLKWKDVTNMIQEEKYGHGHGHGHGHEEADADAVHHARQELDKRIQETPLPAESDADTATTDTATTDAAVEPAPTPPRYIEDNKALISFANKMCIRKKTMDDFIVMKPAPVASSVNLPQIRDYHNELDKRTSTSVNSNESSQ
jgi:hypothetical protein